MKSLHNIFLLALFLITMSSCNLLDYYPHDATSSENLSDDDLELLLTGLYCYSQSKPSFEGYFQNDMAGGDFTRGGGTSFATPSLWIKDCILPSSGWMNGAWCGYYSWLFQVNCFIEGAESKNGGDSTREMLGTAYFFRGLIYYNLVSKYRRVQILRHTTNEAVPNSPEEDGWDFVEENLYKAMEYAPAFSSKNYVSSVAAKALLARTKLGRGKKEEASKLAEEVISETAFELADFEDIFREKPNKEEIFTFSNKKEESGINFCSQFYQPATTYVPTREIIDLFVGADKRRNISIEQQNNETVLNKYNNATGTNPIVIIRLAEMYLISAEGKGLSGGGLTRLNQLRAKRGLNAVSCPDEETFLSAVLAERRLEFLGEGFRWFDLSRTGRLTGTLDLPEKYAVFPIPQTEIDKNPKLVQNDEWKDKETI